METSIPVLPKARLGTTGGLSEASAARLNGANIVPALKAPAVFMKSLRDNLVSLLLVTFDPPWLLI
jgi:hypothetical protein